MIARALHLPEGLEDMWEHFPIDANPGIANS
jgi:hypothetical protein